MASMPPPHMLAQLLQGLGGPGGPGGPPGARPGGGPPPNLAGLQKMGASPPGQEEPIYRQAMDAIGTLMSRFQMRAPEVARELATALVHVKKAMDKSATLPAEPVASPPPGMPAGGGMIGDMSNPGMPGLGG